MAMFNQHEVLDTIRMIDQQKLDVRTITLGISLRGCASDSLGKLCDRVYDHICRTARDLCRVGRDIEEEFGIPIVNKRISVTPSPSSRKAPALRIIPRRPGADRAAKEVGVNFIGGYSALVHKGMTQGDRALIRSIPQALASTELVCASVNVGTTRAGINMDAVYDMGKAIKGAAELTADKDGIGAAKLVAFCNAVEDNLHGRRVPRRGRAGLCDQRGRFRPRRGQIRAGNLQGPAL